MKNLWHTHGDGKAVKHTHAIDGSKVEHKHEFNTNPDDAEDPIEVVSFMDFRFKRPPGLNWESNTPDGGVMNGTSTTLEVQKATTRSKSAVKP